MAQLFGSRRSLLRKRGAGTEPRVEVVELFFDLVFVFAVTQLSHYVLHHMSPGGVVQATLLLCAVWWVWVYTAWCTNWLDPRRPAVRALIFLLMLAGVVLAASIPDAFGARGSSFAGAYVFMQLGRTGFMLWSLRLHRPANFRNFARIIIWLFASSVFWIAGGLTIGLENRFILWLIAVAVEYVSPSVGFRVPGMGASATKDWDVDGAHLAERCGLFVIIALGESILVAGATFADLAWTGESITAFVAAFVGIVAMWWIYFNVGADYASRKISDSPDPGRMARVAYTYLPIVVVAGIIVVAVGDEIMLRTPFEPEDSFAGLLAIIGGAAIYVLGNGLFKAFVFGRWPLSHLAGLGLLAAASLVGLGGAPLPLGIAASAILVLVAAWEFASLRSLRGPA